MSKAFFVEIAYNSVLSSSVRFLISEYPDQVLYLFRYFYVLR